MRHPKATVYTVQQYMLAAGMAFAFLQFGILIFVGSNLLPLLGPPDTPAVQRFMAFAKYAERFKLGNYLMTLPIPFFLLFLGGIQFHFRNIDNSYRSILSTAVFSGVAFIMIWPMGAIVFDNLSFRYSSTSPWVLKNLHVSIQANEKVDLSHSIIRNSIE